MYIIIHIIFNLSRVFYVIFSGMEDIMQIYNRIKTLCKQKGTTITETESTLGFARGSLCKIDKNKPSIERIEKLAAYFGTSTSYITTGIDSKPIEPESDKYSLKPRDQKEITAILSHTEQLLQQEGLMFDGEPASRESIDSILSAMAVGMELAKKRNKKLFTPKKYKKEQ